MWEPLDPKVREEIRAITGQFLKSGEPTPTHGVRVRLGSKRRELDVAIREGFVTIINNNYLPRMRALDLEDEHTRGLVRDYTQHVLLALQHLYSTSGRTQFSVAEVRKTVGESDALPSRPGITDVGVLFAVDFVKYIASWGISGGTVNLVNVKEEIIDFQTIDTAWKEELESREARGFPPEADGPAMPAQEGESGRTGDPMAANALPNRERLVIDINSSLATGVTSSLLFIDLDGFKSVNDTGGHQVGDKCLDTVVNIASEAIRGKGKMYRYGGDEFAIVLPNFDSAEARATAERIRAAIEASDPAGGPKVTASIGLICSDQTESTTAEDLVNFADQAMYKSKQSGGNQVTLHTVSRGPEQTLSRRTPGNLNKRVDAAEVSTSLLQAVSENYIVLVKNDSNEEVSVTKLTLERGGLELSKPVVPKEPAEWTIGPRSGREISWNPAPDPVRTLQMSQAPPASPVDIEIVVACEILGTRKEFRRKILVVADYANHRLDSLSSW